jgi:putative serine protease PepD
MTQPPLQPPQPPQEDPQHTTPLRYGQTQAQPEYPAYPPVPPREPAEPRPAGLPRSGDEPAQSAKTRRLVELVAVAVLAAILASAGTYALTRSDDHASPATQTGTRAAIAQGPVVQANPAAPNWSVTAGAVAPSVVAITVVSGQSGGQGSGVIFDTQSHILTNDHVVGAGSGQGARISVTLNDKRTYDATIVGTDPSADLAVIKLTNPPNDLKAIALGDSDTLKVGDPTMAVGNPLGLAGTVTTGIVSALDRPVATSAQPSDPFGQQQAPADPVVTNAVQTSAAINPGNSGGALVNGSGQLIGINSSIASLGAGGSSQGGNIGIGFAIPANESKSVADQLIASGKATHAFLGVGSDDGVVIDGPAKRPAAVLTSVAPGTPGAKVGLKVGDAIIAIDGEPIDGQLSLIAQVRERTPGDKVTLKVISGGQTRDVSVTLAARPTTG